MKFHEDAGLKVPLFCNIQVILGPYQSGFVNLVFFLLVKKPVLLEFLEDLYIEGVKSIGRSNILMKICIGCTQGHLINHMSSSTQSISNLVLLSFHML